MRKIYLMCLSVLLLSILTMDAFAQKTVTGTVKDSGGNPIPGVSVLEKGTQNGTSTNNDGKFTITVGDGARLIIKSIGLASREILATANLTIIMLEDSNLLNEVVVTGLGEERKTKSLGYSVPKVSGDLIRSANTVNPISSLQGLVPGLVVSPGTGGAQSTPKFQIRGASSLTPGANAPLVVIDGIMLSDDAMLPSKGGEQDFGNILKDIAPDDIESVSILKGGSVVALYGSRATNGVILITTKKGYSQKGLGITFNHNQTFDTPYAMADIQKEYGSGFNIFDVVTKTDGSRQINPASYGFSFGPKLDGLPILDAGGDRSITNSFLNDPLTLFNNGRYINSNLSFQGGNDKTTFRLSYSNNVTTGISPNNKLTRNSLSFRGTQRLADILLLDASISYVNTNSLNPLTIQGDNNLIYALSWGTPTNYDLGYWKDHYTDDLLGGINTNDPYGYSSLFYQLNRYKQEQKEDNFKGVINAKLDLTKWLQFEAMAAVSLYDTNLDNMQPGTNPGFKGGYYETRQSKFLDNRFKGNFNLKEKVGDFDLFLQFGADLFHSELKGSTAYTSGGLNIPNQFRLSNSINLPTVNEYTPNINQNFALFGQSSIGYKDWLTLNLYGRNEWNSTLVYKNETGNYRYFYPGADLAFIFTDAFKLPKIFSYGKLRASYAILGGGTGVYNANTGYYLKNGNYIDVNGASIPQYSYSNNTLGNTDLKPTRSFTKELGFELKMFNNRLGVDFTAYKKNSKNQIIGLNTSQESGVNARLINSGDVQDKGIELMLSGTPIKTKDFSWDAYFNYTLNRTKIIALAPGVTTVQLAGGDGIRTIAEVGGEYGTLVAAYGYAKFQARDGSGNPIDDPNNGKRVLTASGSTRGAVYARASNYNGLEKEVRIGSIQPKFYGGIRNVFNYKAFSLSALIDAKVGGWVFSSTYNYASQTGNLANTLFGRDAEHGGVAFTQDGVKNFGIVLDGVFAAGTIISGVNVGGMTHQETIDRGLRTPTPTYNFYNNSNNWGNGIRERGAFESSWVSLRDVNLSYDLPKKIAERIKMNGVRVTVGARNVAYLYNNAPDNINIADFTGIGSGDYNLGGGSPYVRSISFGINGSF